VPNTHKVGGSSPPEVNVFFAFLRPAYRATDALCLHCTLLFEMGDFSIIGLDQSNVYEASKKVWTDAHESAINGFF